MTQSVLKGFGPKSTQMLQKVGISSIEELMQIDPYQLYSQLKKNLPGTSLNMLYAIIAAQEGTDWREVARNRKTEILFRLDDMGLAP